MNWENGGWTITVIAIDVERQSLAVLMPARVTGAPDVSQYG